MSKQLRIWLFVLLGTLLTSTSLLAEGVITMTTSKAVGEKISLVIEANGNVTIEGIKEVPRTGDSQVDYTLTSQTLTIRGDVTYLGCRWNSLTSLDLSGCTALTSLDCSGNPLTSLDVSSCTALTQLVCGSSRGERATLTSLKASGCTALKELQCQNNQLTNLNVSGCTALTTLDCYNNPLTSLNVSGCTALTTLSCWNNQLTSLNVSGCTALTTITCSSNQLTSLDVSQNTSLTTLECSYNPLTSLDVSGCTSLTKLECNSNQLTSLDLSKNTALTTLQCYNNQLTSLNVSGCSALTKLYCGGNQLTSLDVSGCTALTTLDCSYNQLTSLGLSACLQLNSVDCSANQIKGEEMAKLVASLPIHNNGGNQGELGIFIIVSNLASEGNVCSKDDVATARAKNWNSLKKINVGELLPYEGEDDNLQVGNGVITMTTTKAVGETIALAIQADGGVAIEGAKTPLQPDGQVAYYTLTSQTVTIRGDVTALGCNNNQLTNLDVSQNTALTKLYCGGNQLTSLDVSGCTALTQLVCGSSRGERGDLTSLNASGCTTLKELQCQNNQLTNLNVSGCTALTTLYCYNNQLTSLNVSGCAALSWLNCSDNQLTSLDISKNNALTLLYCTFNQLTSLDVSKNSSLTWLLCYNNQLTRLDVSKDTALTKLYCGGNQLTSLDVSKNTALTDLGCSYNQLTSLDLSTCPQLNYVDCSANQIKGKAMSQLVSSLPTCTSDFKYPLYNYSGGYFIVVSNSAQEENFCLKSEVASARTKNWTSLKSIDGKLIPYKGESDNPQQPVGSGIIKMTTTRAIGETIKLGFKANGEVVIEGAKTPLQPDGQVAHYTLTSQTIIIRGDLTELNCAGSQLDSLDVSDCPSLIKLSCGIPSGEKGTLTSLKASGCTALTELYCGNNPLISLDVSGCTALTKLVVGHKDGDRKTLTSLNASGCTALTQLDCYWNQLTSLDISGCTALTYLNCSYNQLTSLDVSGCAALTTLSCYGNQLTNLDISGCTALTYLNCSHNQLATLDVSKNTALIQLDCSRNQLTSLNVSGCTALTKLDCWYNRLTSLDLSGCTALTELDCWYNQLTSLDVSKNTSLTELDCGYNQLTSLDLSQNTALTLLDCGHNQLTSLDLSHSSALTELNCYSNALTSLDLSKCLNLRYVDCSNNRIKGEAMNRLVASLPTCSGDYYGQYRQHSSYPGGYFVAVSSDDNEWNFCSKENIATARAKNWTPLNKKNGFRYYNLELVPYEGVDLNQPMGHGVITMTTERAVGEPITLLFRANGGVALEGVKEILQSDGSTTYQILPGQKITFRGDVTALSCGDSELTSLNVSGCPSLTQLNCGGNKLTSLDVSQNRALQRLVCHKNQLTGLDVSQNSFLALLSCGDNQLTSLDVSQNSALAQLGCDNNQLTSLDVSQNAALTLLYCGGNQLISLDVSQNAALENLYCNNNQLTSLDVSQNLSLYILSCKSNQLTSLDLSHNSKLMELSCYYNQIKGAEMTKLVNSLPKKDGGQSSDFYVVVKDSIEGNVCLKSDVAILENKGWTPLGYNRSTEAWEYYGGRETDSFGVSLTHEGEGLLEATGADNLKAVPYGTELTINATPAEGYELVALTANGGDILESKSFVVIGYTEIKATFTKKNFAVTLAKDGEGMITATGADDLNAVAYGTELTIIATPTEGYELTALTANGTDILASQKVTIKEAVEVKATFTKKHFVVTLPQEVGGTIRARGAKDLRAVPYGTELIIEATPAEGYELTTLTANGQDILATRKVVITEATEIKATFAKKTFVVTLPQEVGGTIRARGAKDLRAVPYGTELIIEATPAEGYELTTLTANGQDILATRKVVITEATEIKATFAKKTFVVTLEKAGEGDLSTIGTNNLKKVPYGTELTIIATPAEGYELKSIVVDGVNITDSKKIVVTDNLTIKATFAKKSFAVTFDKEGEGTITATGASNLNSVAYGTELTIVATPAAGYELQSLVADGVDITATKKIVVTDNLTVKATFTKKTFAVKLTKEGEGTITATGATSLNAVAYGTELTIVATPAEGYELTALTANGTDILASQKVTVQGATEVKATFTKKTFAVTLTKEGEGTITATGADDLNAVPYGTELTINATPAEGYKLTALTANGTDILATKKVVIEGATEVKATFVDHTGVETTVTQQTQLYPNPATDYVIVEGVAPASEVTLHSMTGERLYAGRADGRGTLQIDLSAYADGVYLVCVAGETYRVVVRR